ncbi:MAG: hydrogenase formation protein HypD [Saprospiraceae bacterium]|nr:hydrogenase formation protein HypD [Saprospiraceae bacterium]
MKYLEEYRDRALVEKYLDKIHHTVTKPWNIMEICGGQTHSLVKNGIVEMLPHKVKMIHGPGCPVCVTPVHLIDHAIALSHEDQVILCSFGDMLRVPGSSGSLLEAKAQGADVRIMYSPLDALQLARKHPEKEVVFFAVGFETTAPAIALSVIRAAHAHIENYSLLTSHVLVPPAVKAILEEDDHVINALLAAGHVCTIMGLEEYYPLSGTYQIPIVATGFEPVDLVQGILMAVVQLEKGIAQVENQYARMVQREGNRIAQDVINSVFQVTDQHWRGIGKIPSSGLMLRDTFAQHDAQRKFALQSHPPLKDTGDCIAGLVLKGVKKPMDCPMFGHTCTPENPLGAPMVSSEGACAAYYHFSGFSESLAE